MKKIVILHNIRSAYNVGSIFRTADGAGVSKIYLVGYTSLPIDRFGRVQPEIKKTSLGASDTVEWEHIKNIENVFDVLCEEGVEIVAVEQHLKSMPYTDFKMEKDTAFIFGNEVYGVPSEICEKADKVIEIPMKGAKESLNVGVAAGIVLFHQKKE